MNPTIGQVECLLAMVYHANMRRAAAALGISTQTLKNNLQHLYRRLGVNSLPNAVYVVWPIIEHEVELPPAEPRDRDSRRPSDRRMGVQRREFAA
jgi:hypothetical protein